MIKAVQYLAVATVLLAIILGIISGNTYKVVPDDVWGDPKFNWVLMISWWIGGIVGGILIGALSFLMQHIQNIDYRMYNLEKRLPAQPAPETAKGNSKASLESLKDYKMGVSE